MKHKFRSMTDFPSNSDGSVAAELLIARNVLYVCRHRFSRFVWRRQDGMRPANVGCRAG